MNRLRRLFPQAITETMPGLPGAYLLSIRLDLALSGMLRGSPFTLAPGTYVYAGSANGPGGIAARVARHMRRDKKPHWHVDTLTLAAQEITALAFPHGSECALVEHLLASGYEAPLPHFGSSDCRTCPAHLLRLQ